LLFGALLCQDIYLKSLTVGCALKSHYLKPEYTRPNLIVEKLYGFTFSSI